MEIHVIDQQQDVVIDPSKIQEIVKEVILHEKQQADEVSVYFVSTEEICQLHQDYFNDPSTTDCISFPMDETEDEPYRILGEIFVCPQTAITYSLKHDKDSYQEMILYVIHGLLHLMGYRDIEIKDRRKMRSAEKKHLQNLFNKKLIN